MLQFRLLDHFVYALDKFGSLVIFSAFSSDRCNVHIKSAHCFTFQRQKSEREEPVGV